MKLGYISKPIQMIKAVWGLRGSEPNHGLTVIWDDSTLMDMDAPASLPAGSSVRCEPLPDTFPGYFRVSERVLFRELAYRP